MKHAKLTAAAAIAATLLLAAPAASAASEADVLREARDRAQIDELMWTYTRAIDTWNADAYAQAFTPDGAFGAVKGRDALRKMVLDLKKGADERAAKAGTKPPPMFHIETNEHVEFTDPDHARLYYYWLTVFGGPAGTLSTNVAAVGHGVDDLVRVDGKWLIQFRNVAPKD